MTYLLIPGTPTASWPETAGVVCPLCGKPMSVGVGLWEDPPVYVAKEDASGVMVSTAERVTVYVCEADYEKIAGESYVQTIEAESLEAHYAREKGVTLAELHALGRYSVGGEIVTVSLEDKALLLRLK
jgi:hypothetical protein